MQLAQRQPYHFAFFADGGKRGGLCRAVHGGNRPQRRAQRIRIVGLDCRYAAAGEAEAGQYRFGERDGLGQPGHIVARLGANKEARGRGAIGESAGDRFQPDLRHLVDLHGQHVRRQPVAVTRQRLDHLAAVLGIVKHHDRLLAAGLRVGRQQHAQFAQQRIGCRQSVSRRAGRAGGSALAAAGADEAVDGDMIAIRCDRPGRAEIEAAAAADNLGARMRAQVLGVGDVARLVETAGQVARLQYHTQHRRRVAGIGAQIAVAQVGGWEQRRAAGEVDQQVVARLRLVARGAEAERIARRRLGCGVAVDHHIKGAEIAGGRADCALREREIGDALRWHRGAGLDQHRDVEVILQQFGRFERLLVLAVDQSHAFAVEGNERDLRRGLRRGGEQCRHFGRGCLGVLRPAGGLTNIDEADAVAAFDLCGDFGEQRRFLRAGDGNRLAFARRLAHAIEFGAAKLTAFENLGATAGALDRLAVERHGVFAGTDQDFTRPFGHRARYPLCWPAANRCA